MSGSNSTETAEVVVPDPVIFAAIRYSELLEADGVTVQGPVAVDSERKPMFAHAGSLRLFTA